MIRRGTHPTAVVDVTGESVLPESTVLEPLAVVYVGPRGRLSLGERNILYPHASIRIDEGQMVTGAEVSFGPGCHVYEPRGGLEIGDYCLIGGGSLICGVNHGLARLDLPMRHQPAEAGRIVIEDDVWLGMGVVVLPGVRIGRGAVIGAGSVVTRDIPGYSIAMGSPCTVRGRRGTRIA